MSHFQLIICSFFVFLIIAPFISFSSGDPLITVCTSSQYKRVVEDTCASVYKRTKHPNSHHHWKHIEKHRSRHYYSKTKGIIKSNLNVLEEKVITTTQQPQNLVPHLHQYVPGYMPHPHLYRHPHLVGHHHLVGHPHLYGHVHRPHFVQRRRFKRK